MIRSRFGNDPIAWRRAEKHLAYLLEPRLVVLLAEFFTGDVGVKEALHHSACGLVTAVFVDGAQERFESARKNGLFAATAATLFPLAQPQHGSDFQLRRLVGKHC